MAPTAKPAGHEKAAAKPACNKHIKKVLIVENHREVAELISDILSRELGLKTTMVADALAARLAAKGEEGPFNLAIINMYLEKGMNGLQLIKWLEKESPATHPILMSSYDISESHVITLLKPIEVDTLIKVVRAELGL